MAIDATTDARLSRLHAALMTPCDADENIAHGCLKKLVAHVKGLGIDGLYVGGSTGEGLLHSVDERIAVFNTVAEAAGDSARIAHVGAISTRDAVTLAKGAAASGYDAVSAIPPIYFPHRKEAIFAYYQDILAATDLPLIIYNIPAMSGVSFSLDDLGRLLNLPGVAGIKQTAIDMYQMEQLARAFPGKILLNGYDEMLLAGLSMGANGGIGSTYNILGDRYLRLMASLKDDLPRARARALQSQCNAIIDELVRVGVFPGLKYLLHKMGVIATPVCRRPLATLAATPSLDDIAASLAC